MADRYRYEPDEVCLQKNDTGRKDKCHAARKGALCALGRENAESQEKAESCEIAGETEGRAARWVEAPQTARGLLTEAEG